MNKKEKEEFLKRHIKNIAKEFDFDVRSKKHPNACPLYKTGKPCHKMKNLNCFLCYCPNYDTSRPSGGCSLDSARDKKIKTGGKWYFNKKLPEGKIWDCSDCTYPHQRKVVEKHLSSLFYPLSP